METREKWNLVHLYRRYASLGAVPEIMCPECDDDVSPVVDKDGNPALQCFRCRVITHLGLHVYDQMRANIKEFDNQVASRSASRPTD